MSWIAQEHDPEWPFDDHATPFDLDPDSTALLVVDVQAGDLVKDPDTKYGRKDELVVDKLTSSAFHNTILDHALRNMGITGVVITGVLTDMCILGTARVAAELGYNALIAEDWCGTLTQRAHDEALLMHARVFGRVSTSTDVITELETR